MEQTPNEQVEVDPPKVLPDRVVLRTEGQVVLQGLAIDAAQYGISVPKGEQLIEIPVAQFLATLAALGIESPTSAEFSPGEPET